VTPRPLARTSTVSLSLCSSSPNRPTGAQPRLPNKRRRRLYSFCHLGATPRCTRVVGLLQPRRPKRANSHDPGLLGSVESPDDAATMPRYSDTTGILEIWAYSIQSGDSKRVSKSGDGGPWGPYPYRVLDQISTPTRW